MVVFVDCRPVPSADLEAIGAKLLPRCVFVKLQLGGDGEIVPGSQM